MTAKPCAFDDAAFYECLDRDSELSHTTVAEALEAAIDNAWEIGDTTDILIARIAPVKVTAHARKTVTNQYISSLSAELFALLEETADEMFGDTQEPNHPLWTGDTTDAIRTELAGVVRRALNRASIYQCDVVGKRSYTAVEIAAILTGETT